MSSDYTSSPGLPPLDGPGTGMQRPSAPQVPMPPGWPSQPSGPRSLAYTSGVAGEPTPYPPDQSGTWVADQPAGGPAASRYRDAEPEDDSASQDAPWDTSPDLVAASKAEYERIARDLDEIRMLIKQSSSELEKLNQRKVLAGAKTREMEEKIETFSRQEIRATYLASSEAEMRAFMIAEQREQLQAKEKAFERYHGFLRRTIEVLTSLPQGGMAGAPGAPTPAWGPAAPSHLPDRAAPPRDEAIAALSRVIQAQEDVRQRVAQRLHDGPAQSLANVVLTAEICEKLVQSDPRRAQGELGNLKGLVNTTLQDTRKFIFELRPMTLDDLGLVPTLRRYIADVGAKYQVQVTLVAPQGDQRLPHYMEVPIFRVAQEAIANAVQHGRATQARVTVSLQPDVAVLIVEDNGTGFDVEPALAKAAARQTIGIASMQERAEMLGGWLRIESARGHGSRVELNVPVAAHAQRVAQ